MLARGAHLWTNHGGLWTWYGRVGPPVDQLFQKCCLPARFKPYLTLYWESCSPLPLLQPVLVIIPTSPWRPPFSPQIAQSCSKRSLQKGPSPVTLAILRGSECASVCPLWAIKGHRYIPTGCQYDAALGRLSIPQRAQAAPPTQLWNFGATLIIAWNTPSLHREASAE